MNPLLYLPWILVIFCIYLIIKSKSKTPSEEEPDKQSSQLNIKGAYKQKWMFSYNEKDAYQKLKEIAEKNGYTVFAKVRLLDILEPVKGTEKYKTFFYKVQAKHVDFVLCDSKLVARYIIELDDNSHKQEDRKQRDEFVDAILTNVGYKILHVNGILPEQIEELLKS